MDLVTPGIGLIFWSTLTFLLLLILLRKYAWNPVLKAVKSREERIKGALESAEEAKKEMERLKADNEVIIREAMDERNKLLQNARGMKEKIVEDAKVLAIEESKKILESARAKIVSEKEAAISEIRKQVAELSVKIAEKILKEELKDTRDHKRLIKSYMDDIYLN